MARVWAGRIIEENTLQVQVSALRGESSSLLKNQETAC
jgi:DNA-binding winged helix-turn-helix (wHTH) protein